MSDLFKTVFALPYSFDTLVYIGAGDGKNIELLSNLRVKKIVCFEPHPISFSNLQQRIGQLSSLENIECINKGLGHNAAICKLYGYNVAECSSLLRPKNLKSLYPGLTSTDEWDIELVSPIELINHHHIDKDYNNLLLVDMSGSESEVFSNVDDVFLDHFSNMIIRTSKEELYDQYVNGFVSVTSILNDKHIDYVVLPETSPSYIHIVVSRSVGSIATRNRFEQQCREIEKIKNQCDKFERKNHQLSTDLKRKKSLLKDHESEVRLLNEKVSKCFIELDSHTSSMRELENLNGNLEETVRFKTAALERSEEQNRELELQLNNTLETLSLKKEEGIDLTRKVEENQKALFLSQKMLAKANNDLDNLRLKYKEKLDSESVLIKLVTELRDKLSLGSSYYVELKRQLDDSVALIEKGFGGAVEPSSSEFLDLGNLEDEANSLLTKCAKIIEQSSKKPIVRILHHFACTGGTVISKCVASMPNTYLLSEAHPTTNLNMHAKPEFRPTDLISLCRFSQMPNIDELSRSVFQTSIMLISKLLSEVGCNLVIREHTHSDYCLGEHEPTFSEVIKSLSDSFNIKSAVTIRDPIDSYISLKKNGWIHFNPSNFEEYCRRYLKFLENFEEKQIIKYEAFVENPQAQMERLCNLMQLDYSDDFLDYYDINSISGGSGRKSSHISRRERRSVSLEMQTEINNSLSYKSFVQKYQYEF